MRFDRWRYDVNSNVFKRDHIAAVTGTVDQEKLLAAILLAEQIAVIRRYDFMVRRLEQKVREFIRRHQEGEE